MRWFLLCFILQASISAATKTVCSSGACDYTNANSDDAPISAAVTAATCGDVISIATETLDIYPVELKPKTCSGYIYIQGARWNEIASLPRVTSAHSGMMPILYPKSGYQAEPIFFTYNYYAAAATVSSVDTDTDTITFSGAHGWSDGQKIAGTTNPPDPANFLGGLAINANYYVRDAGATTIKVALTPGGAAVNITSAGSGTRKFAYVGPGHHYIIRGLEITQHPTIGNNIRFFQFGNDIEFSPEAAPHHITLDRVYVHGRAPLPGQLWLTGPRVPISIASGRYLDFTNSTFSGAKDNDGNENKVFNLGANAQNIRIINNYISGAGMCLLSGGLGTNIYLGNTTNVTLIGNHCNWEGWMHWKSGAGAPPAEDCFYDTYSGTGAYYLNTTGSPADCTGGNCYRCSSGRAWVQDTTLPLISSSMVPKARIEFKTVDGLIAHGNVITWGGVGNDTGNPGSCMLFSQIYYPGWEWFSSRNAEVAYNWCRQTWRFINAGTDSPTYFTHQNSNLTIHDNLGTDLVKFPAMSIQATAGAAYSNAFQGSAGTDGHYFYHNTVTQAATDMTRAFQLEHGLTAFVMDNFKFSDNIITPNSVLLSGSGTTCPDLAEYFSPTKLLNSVVVGSGAWPLASCSTNVAVETSITLEADYSITPASKYSKTCVSSCGFLGTDGKEIGADITYLNWYKSGTLTGEPRWLTNGWSIDTGSTKALLSYTAPSASTCDVVLYTDAARITEHGDTNTSGEKLDNRSGNYSSGTQRIFLFGTNTALTASTTYYGTVSCGTQVRPFELRTKASGAGRSFPVIYPSARTGEYSASSSFSSPTSVSSAATHIIPVSANSVIFYRETNGIARAYVAP